MGRSRARARGFWPGGACGRNYVALGFLLLFVLIVVACMLAGPYARHVAHTTPNENHLGETFTKNGKQVEIVSKGGFSGNTFKAGGIPVGPQLWHAGGTLRSRRRHAGP